MTTLKASALLASIAGLLCAPAARAQSLNDVSVEINQTLGHSSEDVSAAGTQMHVFGEVMSGIRFSFETAWAWRSADRGDAFETAYPYEQRLQVVEAYGERVFTPGRGLLAVRIGRYRTPFGISSASDHAYIGFLRAPLIRYEDYYALSNNFLEHGADVVVGTPRLSVETSVGTPGDVGDMKRQSGVDTAVRGQGTIGSLIVGVSHLQTKPNMSPVFAKGEMSFTGVDARWMRSGIQLRGEWIWGQPFNGTTTNGGYADVLVHKPSMGPVTLLARAERLGYDTKPPFALYAQRYTAGARVRFFNRLSAEVEIVRQTRSLSTQPFAVDAGLTYSVRKDSRH